MSAAHLRERKRTVKPEISQQHNMSHGSDSDDMLSRQPSQDRRTGSWGKSGPFRNGKHLTRYSSGEELLEDEDGRMAIERLDREGEQVVFMQPRIIELRLKDEEEGDPDQDSGISCEDHLLKVSEGLEAGGPRGPQKEKLRDILVQVFVPFMIAGLGMMAAGLLLDAVQVCTKSKVIEIGVSLWW